MSDIVKSPNKFSLMNFITKVAEFLVISRHFFDCCFKLVSAVIDANEYTRNSESCCERFDPLC